MRDAITLVLVIFWLATGIAGLVSDIRYRRKLDRLYKASVSRETKKTPDKTAYDDL